LGESGYNSGTPTLRLLTEVLALDTEDRVNICSIAPYGNNLAISSLPSPESFVSTLLIYAHASKLQMTYPANAIAHHTAVRASMDPPRAPYQYAAYEWNTDHFTAGSSRNATDANSRIRSLMRETYHGDLQLVEDTVFDTATHWATLGQ